MLEGCINTWLTAPNSASYVINPGEDTKFDFPECSKPAFLKLWSADHKWSSGSALVVLLD